jgi:hypothetical protein
LTAIDYFTK